MKKSLLASLLAISMMSTVLTGCGGNAGDGQSQTQGQTESQGETRAESVNETEEAAGESEEASEETFDMSLFENQEGSVKVDPTYVDEKVAPFILSGADYESISRDEDYVLPSGVMDFTAVSLDTFFNEEKGDNLIFSPVNMYMALSMLAETTEGETRDQIMKALGCDSIDQVRERAQALFNQCFENEDGAISYMGNSMWLGDGFDYAKETMDAISQYYNGSVMSGSMGSSEYNEALQAWINAMTGDLLKEQTSGIEMDPTTVLALVSSLYFKGSWGETFKEGDTSEDTFHGKNGDEQVDFMHQTLSHGVIYDADHFSAMSLSMSEGNHMWIILPDKDVEMSDLVRDEQVFKLITSAGNWESVRNGIVTLSLPKFDLTSDLDIIEGLQSMGIEDVFSFEKADFAPLFEDGKKPGDMAVTEVRHAARVKVDEKGVEAAAYTEMMVKLASALMGDLLEFNVNKPFMFVISNSYEVPLFMGMVNGLK